MTAGGRAKVGRGGGILAPLRVPMFRAVWGANLIGSTGWLVQGVGAAWLMTTLAGTPDMVALVQTATMAPILLFALFAGALADLWDRRWVLLVAQLWVAVAAFGLAGISAAGLLTPTVLLLFTFLIGTGAALNGPAWQAVVRELVPGEQLAAAVTLNAIGFNLARALGPAVGGAVVATFGTEAAFLLNGIAALALVAVLLFWRRQLPKDDLPRERLGSAVATGLRYVGETAALRGVLTRAAVFGIAASAGLALLPLIARDRLGGGPVIYGLLLGAFGVGALLGAFLIHPLRQRRGAEFVITAAVGRRRPRLRPDRPPALLVRRRRARPGGRRHRLAGRVLDLQHQRPDAHRLLGPGARAGALPDRGVRRHGPGLLGLGRARRPHRPGDRLPPGGCRACWAASPCTGACRSPPARRPTSSPPSARSPCPRSRPPPRKAR